MTPLPFDLVDRYAAWKWEPVWETTYEFTRGQERRFVKLSPAGRALPDEAQRLRWASGRLPVPHVVEYGTDGETDWLITEALPGVDATRFETDPRRLAVALGEGLKNFHSRVPPRECPFDFTVPTAVAHVRARAATGLIAPEDLHQEHRHWTVDEAVEHLVATAPEPESEVVCHGDYCLPNVLLVDGRVTGYVDLGGLAVAEPWWDLAVGSWSVTWNLGSGYEGIFFDAYGITPDEGRIAWYRLLCDFLGASPWRVRGVGGPPGKPLGTTA
jgi:kanamycin kinase